MHHLETTETLKRKKTRSLTLIYYGLYVYSCLVVYDFVFFFAGDETGESSSVLTIKSA